MNNFRRLFSIKGNGAELFVRATRGKLEEETIRKIVGNGVQIIHRPPNNYCFLVFKDHVEAANAIQTLKNTEEFAVRQAYIKMNYFQKNPNSKPI